MTRHDSNPPLPWLPRGEESCLFLVLEVLHQHAEGLGLLAELGDHGARAPDHLGGLTLIVDLAQAAELTQLLAGVDHEQVHAALLAEGAHKLGVLRVVAVRRQAAELSGLLVERLGAPEATLKDGAQHREPLARNPRPRKLQEGGAQRKGSTYS